MGNSTFIKNFRILLLTGLLMMLNVQFLNAQILAWDFTGEASVVTSTAEIMDANLDASSELTRGAGAPASAGANSFRTQGFQNDGINVSNTDYFQFELSAATGYEMSLSSIDAVVTGTGTYSASPGASNQFAYSLDGVSFTLIDVPTMTIGTFQSFSVDLSSVAALQSVSESVTVTFRYYASGQTTTGGWGFNSPSSGVYGLSINGAVVLEGACVPTSSNQVVEACQTYNFFGTDYTESGNYEHILVGGNAAGCDSTIYLDLTIVSGYTFYEDFDSDGFGNPNVTVVACTAPMGYVENGDDCDDTDDQIGVASEVYYVDSDGDGFGTGDAMLFCSDPGAGYSLNNDDCDDTDDTIYPGATDIPDDGIDQDCDGEDATLLGAEFGIYEFNGTVDCSNQDLAATVSSVNVTFSDYSSMMTSCAAGGGVFNRSGWNTTATIDLDEYNEFTITPEDCFDLTLTKVVFLHRNSATGGTPTWTLRSSEDGFTTDIATGQSSTTDETTTILLPASFENVGEVTFRFYITNMGTSGATWRNDNVSVFGFENPLPSQTYYLDADGDGFGDILNQISACSQPEGYVTNDGDCDDTDASINPDTYWYQDLDEDGYGNSSVFIQTCQQPIGYVLLGLDCDDNNANVNPGAPEVCNGTDDNCNGEVDEGLVFVTYYVDADGDGYGTGTGFEACEDPGVGYATNNDDCDDTDENITLPTSYYVDADGDGFGVGDAIEFCIDPGAGYALIDGDCDDTNDEVYPGANEICNGEDDNCNGDIDEGLDFTTYYVDADGDGFGAGVGIDFCEDPGAGYSLNDEDCDDSDNTIYPGAIEIPNDGIDQDCDGEDLVTIGFKENEGLSFSVVPNPSNGEIVVKLSSNFNSTKVEVFALTGELVAQTDFAGSAYKLNLTALNTGMYLIKISNESGTAVQRIVKR